MTALCNRNESMVTRIRVRQANSLGQRLRRRWRAWRGAGMVKSHAVHIVRIEGLDFKRVTFGDSATAAKVARGLEHLGRSGCFPQLLMHHASQVWVDFVAGRAPRPGDPADRPALIDFFVRLYRQPDATCSSQVSAQQERLQRDLAFLVRVDVLDAGRAGLLAGLGERLCPDRVWVGYDYVDPLAKNFILSGTTAVAIDVEALLGPVVLGAGLAKARLRWPFDPTREVLTRLADDFGRDLRPQAEWAELCFLAEYCKQKVLQGKPGYLRLDAFDRMLEGHV